MKSKKRCLSKRSILLTTSLLALVLAITGRVSAAEIDHYYKPHDALITKSCSNSTWQEVTEYRIASTNFTAGKKYLIVINFSILIGTDTNQNAMARVLHGNAVFSDSTFRHRTRTYLSGHCGHGYHYWTVWQAVSGEDIRIEVTQPTAVATDVYTEEYEAFIINLSDDLSEGTDWSYQAETHSGDVPDSWTPGASVTFDGANHDWLVLGLCRFVLNGTASYYAIRTEDFTDGKVYSQIAYLGADVNDYRPIMNMVGLTNVGPNHTVGVTAMSTSANRHDWSDSKIFVLDLNKFQDHWTGYSTTSVSLSVLNGVYEVYGKGDYLTSQTGNVLIWSQEVADVGENTKSIVDRIQVNGSTVPSGHQDARRELAWGSSDEDAHHHIYLDSLSQGYNDIDIDMAETVDVSPAPVIDIHSLVIFSMELFAGPTSHYVDGDTGDDGANVPYRLQSAPAKTIQAAINASNIGTVYVRKAAGTYDSFQMESNVNVVGTDATWAEPSSRNDYPTVHNTTRAPVWLLGPLSNCRIANLKVTGGKMEQGQIYVSGYYGEIANDVIIEKCWLYQGSHVGIQLRGAAAPTIKDCDIEDPRTSGISSFLYGIDPASTPMIIQGCDLSGLAGYGDGWGLRAGIGLVAENDGNFDVVIGGDGALANHIHHMGRAGIRLEDLGAGCDITIDNNEINNNSDGQYNQYAPGIIVDNVSKVTIKRNTIHDNMRAGIAIANNSDVTVGAEASVTAPIADIQSQYGNDIYGNYAGVAFGGRDRATSNGTFVIRGNQIYTNRGGARGGIALRGEVTGTVLIKQNEIYDNERGGISIHDDCTAEIIQNNIYNQYLAGGIHTGNINTFYGTNGGADLTIRQNKVHDNLGINYGGGIDVRHASGTIENNIVYNNSRGGIRFSDWIDEIVHNTVVNNGNDNGTPADPSDDVGGGIIYDGLAGAVNDPPVGVPPAPLLIRNNISVYNQKAGIRACFDNTGLERDYNLLYANRPWNDTFNRANAPDCGWPTLDDMSCIKQQYGGCGAYFVKGVGILLDDPNDIIADPLFKDMAGNDYRLQRLSEGDGNDSPAINAGDDGDDMGAYGGTYYIDDSEIP